MHDSNELQHSCMHLLVEQGISIRGCCARHPEVLALYMPPTSTADKGLLSQSDMRQLQPLVLMEWLKYAAVDQSQPLQP
jgi:hypothetical protein